jgi:hypothetical protein
VGEGEGVRRLHTNNDNDDREMLALCTAMGNWLRDVKLYSSSALPVKHLKKGNSVLITNI